ncbi:alpha/beta-hydrolase [Dacryopinax primogenitus]|uniref:Alpha/beta-hydrolase n=1 Tax=Dacryopinax primogenitus (strain DJM 731) TaxID=1858805 RepID=M5FTX7_DACPD|nr:alpha/beta-hydrolase [Dacryopinax primogenitus]EJU01126.1 alpha/beta-hydrolase [Dacryopinax primogenitus]
MTLLFLSTRYKAIGRSVVARQLLYTRQMSFISGTVKLPTIVPGDEPAEFKYFDSQPAGTESTPSTTIISVHGVTFHSAIWDRWLPSLRENNIRLLSYNRRGYEGSPSIHKEDPPSAGLVQTTVRYTLDMLKFMKYAVDELGVQPTDKKRKSGGVVLLGWSKGCIPPIALMASMRHVKNPLFPMPPEVVSLEPMLESYLRAVLLYEPPGTASGRPPTEDTKEFAVGPSEIQTAFYNWVIKKINPDLLPALNNAYNGEHTAHEFSWYLAPDRPTIEQIAYQAFDPVPPNLGVGLMLGEEASDYCKDAGDWIQQRLAQQPHTATAIIPGAGHFAMISHPDAFTKSIVDVLHKLDV